MPKDVEGSSQSLLDVTSGLLTEGTFENQDSNPRIRAYEVQILTTRTSFFSFFHGSTTLAGQGLLIVEVPRSHLYAPHSVGLIWTSDRPVAAL
jgi:hypothetical protein